MVDQAIDGKAGRTAVCLFWMEQYILLAVALVIMPAHRTWGFLKQLPKYLICGLRTVLKTATLSHLFPGIADKYQDEITLG